QVLADIEKEAGSLYNEVSPKKNADRAAEVEQTQRNAQAKPLVKEGRRICLEEVPEMNKYLGPTSRFGDGDGSFWDRWLTTTGYFTPSGKYTAAVMPGRSMYSRGTVPPHSGFKRYQLDKLAYRKNPDPRVLTYAARRERGDAKGSSEARERLYGANSEVNTG
ncbi:unnamed protein product, partial [Sphacelaria rigidula]